MKVTFKLIQKVHDGAQTRESSNLFHIEMYVVQTNKSKSLFEQKDSSAQDCDVHGK